MAVTSVADSRRALSMSGNAVIARKGDTGATIDLRYYHDSDDLTKMVVNSALSRLPAPDQTSK